MQHRTIKYISTFLFDIIEQNDIDDKFMFQYNEV